MAKAKKEAALSDPDKLVRAKAGEYRTGDGRFTVQSQASGAWFVVDSEQLDELGMARVLGPFGTLDEARKAIAQARSAPPVTSFLKARARQKAKSGGKSAADEEVAKRARRDEQPPKPPKPSKPRPPRLRYASSTEGVRANELRGFFADWPDPPAPETLRRLLAGSDEAVLAFDDEAGTVIGFVTALTDRVVAAYIPLLDVLPEYRKLGIADELIRRIVERVGDLRMIDAVPEEDLEQFYRRAGFKRSAAMSIRNVRNG